MQRETLGPDAVDGMRGSMGIQPLTGAYRFSFASKDDELAFLNKTPAVNPATASTPVAMAPLNYSH